MLLKIPLAEPPTAMLTPLCIAPVDPVDRRQSVPAQRARAVLQLLIEASHDKQASMSYNRYGVIPMM